MKTFTKSAISTLFLVCASAAYAAPECIPVDGTVTSEADGSCNIYAAWPNELPMGQLGGWFPGSCFALTGKGKAKFTGFSGLTIAGVNQIPNFDQPATATPLIFPGDPIRSPDPLNNDYLTVFTSNAVLTGKLRNLKGTLYTQDTGAITADGVVGQVLKIVGGTDGFDGAYGTIAVAGQEVGGAALYTGEVCVPR